MEKISVIICTYNPNKKIFERCLKAISASMANITIAEIIIVDNNSTNAVSTENYVLDFLSLNRNAKVVIEKKQGLTPARLKGITESTGDLLIFIDDDNIIAPDFFEQGINVSKTNENIGAWSGQVLLEFEKEPEAWTKKYWGLLVYREFHEDYWSNLPHLEATMPCGAGLFIRKNVADFYYNLHETGLREIQLDRSGKSLFSGGDNDMAGCACDIGLGVGLFHKISVTHCIPSFRVEKEYLLRLAGGIAASTIVLKSYRGIISNPPSYKTRIANGIRLIIKNPIEKLFFKAILDGEKKGRSLVKQYKK